jgi:hypothetical protein
VICWTSLWTPRDRSYLIIDIDLHSSIWLDRVCFTHLMSPPATGNVSTELRGAASERTMDEPERPEDEHEPPKGTLIAMLIYLLLLVLLWTNVYLRLWVRG